MPDFDAIRTALINRMLQSGQPLPIQMSPGMRPPMPILPPGPPLMGLKMAPALYSSGQGGLPEALGVPYKSR